MLFRKSVAVLLFFLLHFCNTSLFANNPRYIFATANCLRTKPCCTFAIVFYAKEALQHFLRLIMRVADWFSAFNYGFF